MGIYDRDYIRDPASRGGFAEFLPFSVTTALIAVNVAVFLLEGLLLRSGPHPRDFNADSPFSASPSPLFRWGHFSVTTAVYHFQIWRVITFQFLHANAFHLFSNSLGLFLFGQVVEGQLGPPRYLAFYLLCGVAGALSYIVLWAAGVLITHPDLPLVGASAGVFGVLVAAATIAPDMTISLYLGFPISIRTLAWISLALAAYTVVSTAGSRFAMYSNAGGEAAHLGGGLLGLLLIHNQHYLNPFHPSPRRSTPQRRPRKRRIFQKDWSRDMNR